MFAADLSIRLRDQSEYFADNVLDRQIRRIDQDGVWRHHQGGRLAGAVLVIALGKSRRDLRDLVPL